jgi:hypothetical protein
MCDFGLFDDHCSIVILLKLSPKPRTRRGPGLLIRVLTVREFYTECNAGFRWSEELFYSTLVGHIHLDKYLLPILFH